MDITREYLQNRGEHFVDYTRKIDGTRLCIWMTGSPKEILMRIGPLDMIQGALLNKLAEKIAEAHGAVFQAIELGGYTKGKSPDTPRAFISNIRKVFTVKMKAPDWKPYVGTSKTKAGQQEIHEVEQRLITTVKGFFQATDKATEFIINL